MKLKPCTYTYNTFTHKVVKTCIYIINSTIIRLGTGFRSRKKISTDYVEINFRHAHPKTSHLISANTEHNFK